MNKEQCITCSRRLVKSKMRMVYGGWWKCSPKGGYKNAIECLHLNDDEIYGIDCYDEYGGLLKWIKPRDRIIFAQVEIEKADRWLIQNILTKTQHAKIVLEVDSNSITGVE